MTPETGTVAIPNQQDLPVETLRRQLEAAYLALEALDNDRMRIVAERDNLKTECEQVKRELDRIRHSRRNALWVLLRTTLVPFR